MMYSHGLRVSEVISIKFSDLDLQQARLWVSRTAPRWRTDETYIKIKGRWRYLYRAAAKTFFRKAFRCNRIPTRVNIDKSGANKAALDHFNNLKKNFTIFIKF